ncbi:MAG: DUF131 domain-containing protein [Promethearchaeota archaeon]
MDSNLMLIGFLIMIVGIAMVMLGAFSSFERGRNAETGGAILIGPIPIIFGVGRKLFFIAVLGALALAILMAVFFLI